MEINLSTVKRSGKPFALLKQELLRKLTHLEYHAASFDCSAIPIGILPSLTTEQINASNMTDVARYTCLAEQIYRLRGQNFNIDIQGDDSLQASFADICAEGANTSFQFHLMVEPEKLVNVFNAAQYTLPLVTAISANSPIFLGNRLWHETRVALFKQSLDMRLHKQSAWQQPTRVNFGFGWVRHSIWELFAEAVALYQPLIPYINQDASANALSELSLHLGTIWPWHRPVYCPEGNGHIRIEFRAIPAGPTIDDMLANAAFAIGLAVGLADSIEECISYLPFRFAEYNFYRAAQFGLNAEVLWPYKNRFQPHPVDIKNVIAQFLPIAHQGLINLNISPEEITYYLNIIEQRLLREQTGATWQMKTFDTLTSRLSNKKACQHLVKNYQLNYQSGVPVAEWV